MTQTDSNTLFPLSSMVWFVAWQDAFFAFLHEMSEHQQQFICVCLSFMMANFSNYWIFKNFVKCAWFSSRSCRWNNFSPGGKSGGVPFRSVRCRTKPNCTAQWSQGLNLFLLPHQLSGPSSRLTTDTQRYLLHFLNCAVFSSAHIY